MERKCRICGRQIKMFGWRQHVGKHKRDFCKAIGRNLGESSMVNYEDVVMYFNPKEANPKKCIGYPIKKTKKLTDYEKK